MFKKIAFKPDGMSICKVTENLRLFYALSEDVIKQCFLSLVSLQNSNSAKNIMLILH